MTPPEKKRYWLVPPEVYNPLDEEFHFTFDPCPYPRPKGFDGRKIDWGKVNWVNPPFMKEDGGPTDFIRKAIAESKKGKTSVIIIPAPTMIIELLAAGAEFRIPPGGVHVGWREVETGERIPHDKGSCAVFVLRGKGAP